MIEENIDTFVSESCIDARGPRRRGVCVGTAGILLLADGEEPPGHLHQVQPGRDT